MFLNCKPIIKKIAPALLLLWVTTNSQLAAHKGEPQVKNVYQRLLERTKSFVKQHWEYLIPMGCAICLSIAIFRLLEHRETDCKTATPPSKKAEKEVARQEEASQSSETSGLSPTTESKATPDERELAALDAEKAAMFAHATWAATGGDAEATEFDAPTQQLIAQARRIASSSGVYEPPVAPPVNLQALAQDARERATKVWKETDVWVDAASQLAAAKLALTKVTAQQGGNLANFIRNYLDIINPDNQGLSDKTKCLIAGELARLAKESQSLDETSKQFFATACCINQLIALGKTVPPVPVREADASSPQGATSVGDTTPRHTEKEI
jgi:hypothetical protein